MTADVVWRAVAGKSMLESWCMVYGDRASADVEGTSWVPASDPRPRQGARRPGQCFRSASPCKTQYGHSQRDEVLVNPQPLHPRDRTHPRANGQPILPRTP